MVLRSGSFAAELRGSNMRAGSSGVVRDDSTLCSIFAFNNFNTCSITPACACQPGRAGLEARRSAARARLCVHYALAVQLGDEETQTLEYLQVVGSSVCSQHTRETPGTFWFSVCQLYSFCAVLCAPLRIGLRLRATPTARGNAHACSYAAPQAEGRSAPRSRPPRLCKSETAFGTQRLHS